MFAGSMFSARAGETNAGRAQAARTSSADARSRRVRARTSIAHVRGRVRDGAGLDRRHVLGAGDVVVSQRVSLTGVSHDEVAADVRTDPVPAVRHDAVPLDTASPAVDRHDAVTAVAVDRVLEDETVMIDLDTERGVLRHLRVTDHAE